MEKGKTLKEVLKIADTTIIDVSKKANIPATTLYSLANKPLENLKVDMLSKISTALNLNLYEYMSDDYILEKSGITGGLNKISYKNSNQDLYRLFAGFPEDKIKELIDREARNSLGSIATMENTLVPTPEEKAAIYKEYLNEMFDNLNVNGQRKAVDQVELLTKIPEYQKKD